MKLTKEMIDKVRHIEGFPIGSDEDIIALSQPPYYTACPNPFIEDFINENGIKYDEEEDDYYCKPFAADISEGKTDPIYMAHAYHTKVPYKAIMRYILHYTKPGDIVFDGFSGTGMTGVAAQMCGQLNEIEKYEYKTQMSGVEFGTRKAILNDLSPIATFLTHNYNSKVDLTAFNQKLEEVLQDCQSEYGWVYQTNHTEANSLFDFTNKGVINYTIWSDVLICPHCGNEIVFWDSAIDVELGKVQDFFGCENCGMSLRKGDCHPAQEYIYDEILSDTVSFNKQIPVLINYMYNGKRYNKKPDDYDLEIINKINNLKIKYWVPRERMPQGSEGSRNDKSGITNVHHFYTKRNLLILSCLLEKIGNDSHLKFLFTSILQRASKLFKWSKNQAGPLSGTLYISSCTYETSVFSLIKNKAKLFDMWRSQDGDTCVNNASLTDVSNIPENSIDYIFTDPPFGDNLMYSELSFIWEAWLRVKTNVESEAIMNKFQNKSLLDYQLLMTRCFTEYFRVLKPGHWMTVEFHNSKNAVWNAIQEALVRSGFIIADVRILNKKQESFKQVNSQGAVKQDLVISVYKPKESFKREFISHQGTVQTAWDFVRQHLEKLPVVVQKGNKIEIIVERQDFLLFDRMIAFHIVNSISVPLDAADFYKGLDEKFIKRDNMYFLHDQVNEYDNARIRNDVEDIQFSLFVSNEKTAIAWLYQQLVIPQTYSMIQPKFMQEIRSIDKYEKLPELLELLEENFLKENNGEWYIPDVNKATDVIRLREKKLVKEFEEYLSTSGKLKKFRTEAVRAGFAKLWKDKNFDLIVKTAERLPEEVVQEDEKLLMYYDLSLSRLG